MKTNEKNFLKKRIVRNIYKKVSKITIEKRKSIGVCLYIW